MTSAFRGTTSYRDRHRIAYPSTLAAKNSHPRNEWSRAALAQRDAGASPHSNPDAQVSVKSQAAPSTEHRRRHRSVASRPGGQKVMGGAASWETPTLHPARPTAGDPPSAPKVTNARATAEKQREHSGKIPRAHCRARALPYSGRMPIRGRRTRTSPRPAASWACPRESIAIGSIPRRSLRDALLDRARAACAREPIRR